jgi:hypothetical protein
VKNNQIVYEHTELIFYFEHEDVILFKENAGWDMPKHIHCMSYVAVL